MTYFKICYIIFFYLSTRFYENKEEGEGVSGSNKIGWFESNWIVIRSTGTMYHIFCQNKALLLEIFFINNIIILQIFIICFLGKSSGRNWRPLRPPPQPLPQQQQLPLDFMPSVPPPAFMGQPPQAKTQYPYKSNIMLPHITRRPRN